MLGGKKRWLNIAGTFAPIILGAVNPALIPVSSIITHAIQSAENTGKTGKEKAQLVVSITNDTITALNTIKGKEVIDPKEIDAALQGAIDTTIAVINLIDSKSSD